MGIPNEGVTGEDDQAEEEAEDIVAVEVAVVDVVAHKVEKIEPKNHRYF